RIRCLMDECEDAHKEFDFWMKMSWGAVAATVLFAVAMVASVYFDWPWPIPDILSSLTFASCVLMWLLCIPGTEALQRGRKALDEADVLLDWLRRHKSEHKTQAGSDWRTNSSADHALS